MCELNLLQIAYFGPLLEILCGLKGSLFSHTVNEEENIKKRVLESLLLLPLHEIAKKGIDEMLREVLNLNADEVCRGNECFNEWMSANESELPFFSDLSVGATYYWNHLINVNSGWKHLAKLALLFGNTLPSESGVERDFSRGRHRAGDRRFSSSLESMDAELILLK
jgi:hypothetical protein